MANQSNAPDGDPHNPAPAAANDAAALIPFEPVPVRRRRDGWTAERQRAFIQALAETGCVSEACAEVGITPRSAQRLALRPDAASFAQAWDAAQQAASRRAISLLYEYATHGMVETVWKNGEIAYERRQVAVEAGYP